MKRIPLLISLTLCLFSLHRLPALSSGRDGKVAVVAHRGFWNCDQAGRAKNSLASLRQAQEQGFWGSEFDVNMTLDEKLLVFHDSVIDGNVIEQNPASTFDYYRLPNGEKIPTLDEYLSQGAKSRTVLVLELKKHSSKEIEDRAVELIVRKLREHKLFRKNRVMFISFSLNICRQFAALAPGFTVQYLDSDIRPLQVRQAGVNGIDTKYKNVLKDPSIIEEARNNSLSINVWTVNKDQDMKELIELGVDQITTDNPLLLREILGADEKK